MSLRACPATPQLTLLLVVLALQLAELDLHLAGLALRLAGPDLTSTLLFLNVEDSTMRLFRTCVSSQ